MIKLRWKYTCRIAWGGGQNRLTISSTSEPDAKKLTASIANNIVADDMVVTDFVLKSLEVTILGLPFIIFKKEIGRNVD